MNKQLTVTVAEVVSVGVSLCLLLGIALYLQHQLVLSRANEREMSARYSELVRTNTATLKHK